MIAVQKMRHLRTESMVMEDRRSCRSWTILLAQWDGETTAIFAMKESSGTRGIKTRSFSKEAMIKHLHVKEGIIGVGGSLRQRTIKKSMKTIMENDGHGVDENPNCTDNGEKWVWSGDQRCQQRKMAHDPQSWRPRWWVYSRSQESWIWFSTIFWVFRILTDLFTES